MTIESTAATERAFATRGLTHHSGEPGVRVFEGAGHRIFHVMDPPLSRKILACRDFWADNYFSPGLRRLEERGENLRWISAFFDHGLLFRNGAEHQDEKKRFHKILTQLDSELLAFGPRIERYLVKRRRNIRSASEFSDQFTRICVGWMVSRLTGIPLARVLRSMRLRCNVWLPYFHPTRLRKVNQSFEVLYAGSQPPDKEQDGWTEHLIAQSLLVMGVDPLAGSIAASLVEGVTLDFTRDVYRFCPTSFVTRICIRDNSVGGFEFRKGDVCLTSLLPAAAEAIGPDADAQEPRKATLAFGAGVHSCIGKSISLTILGVAEQIFRDRFATGFPKTSRLASDGAFLAFR
jgi:hypothetical protein